ncbi:hypothetical protein [Ruegeria sp.]|uniref:hypothetical protein n=1 Tax=Ruegeria sp. TaxID=1879320 RepID=UPI003B58EFE0
MKEDRAVSQEDFDSFLSGDLNWNALGAGAAADRGKFGCICSDEGETQTIDPIRHICSVAQKLDETETNPNNAMESVIVFSEKGTGKSTMVRQAAIELSRKGYPVVVSNPRPAGVKAETLLEFIIYIQDLWAKNREGKGKGYGSIPVCVLLDSDAEIAAKEANLANLLSRELNRKVVLVRVLEKSREEIEKASNVVQIVANTSRKEVLHIGEHLREFCADRDLQEIPGQREWEAYYTGFYSKYQNYVNKDKQVSHDLPHLFLVAIYPFVKERVRDERSLARYLYENWKSIEDRNVRKLVEVVAEAGFYGISLPYECLFKQSVYEAILRGGISKEDEHVFDSFTIWKRYKHYDSSSWSIFARHPAICGMLLNMTAPRESGAPHSNLVELLNGLTGSYADTWLCEAVVSGIGPWFRSGEKEAFGIEFETPRQRAARELLEAIPEGIALESRLICHQYARFHIHILHACLEKLKSPEAIILTTEELLFISKERLNEARVFVDRALKVHKSNEKISNVLNSLAAATSRFAKTLRTLNKEEAEAKKLDAEAIKLGLQAVEKDAANGHALHSIVSTLQSSILSKMNDPIVDLRYFEEAEDRLQTLCTLHANKQWRNSDEVEAELSIARLLEEQEKIATSLNLKFAQDQEFVMRNRVSFLIVKMRTILAGKSIQDGFLDPQKTEGLRKLRVDLAEFDAPNARELGILYRLYTEDSATRFKFETRLQIIEDIRREDPDSAEIFMHDQASLLCQIGEFGAAKEIFQQIRELRQSDPGKWFWMNEKILIDNSKTPPCAKEIVVTVFDETRGLANYSGVQVKIQPRQFGNISRNQPIQCYLRFRLAGLQAIDGRMAEQDMASIGIEENG